MQEVQYLIFDADDCPTEWLIPFNELAAFWRNSWEEVWRELKIEKSMGGEELLRHKLLTGLFVSGRPICFHAYSYFNLNIHEVEKHSYFRGLPVEAFTLLREQGYGRIATMEYLVAARSPEFKSYFGVLPSLAMIGLGCKLLSESLPIDAIVTVTRNNRWVNAACAHFGAQALSVNLAMHNVQVDLMSFERQNIKNHPKNDVTQAIESLWENRADCRLTQTIWPKTSKENPYAPTYKPSEFAGSL